MKSLRHLLALSALAAVSATAGAAGTYSSIGLGFEGVTVPDPDTGEFLSIDLLDFYRGPLGSGSAVGTKYAQDLGVSFSPGTLSGISQDAGGLGDYPSAQLPSGVGALVSLTTRRLIEGQLNQGFGVGVSFAYSADASVTVSLFNADGKLILSRELTPSIVGSDCAGQNDRYFCKWQQESIDLKGAEVRSFKFEGLVAVDNLTFGSLTPFAGEVLTPIPEPSTYALMALGLAGVAAAARRRQDKPT